VKVTTFYFKMCIVSHDFKIEALTSNVSDSAPWCSWYYYSHLQEIISILILFTLYF